MDHRQDICDIIQILTGLWPGRIHGVSGGVSVTYRVVRRNDNA